MEFGPEAERVANGNTVILLNSGPGYAIEVDKNRYITAIYKKGDTGVPTVEDRMEDFDVLPDGNIILTLNRSIGKGLGVMELSPMDTEEWSYYTFKSDRITSVCRLKNGNTLFAGSDEYRIYEVTPDRQTAGIIRLNEFPTDVEKMGEQKTLGLGRNLVPVTQIDSGPSGTIKNDDPSFSWSGDDPDGQVVGFYYRLDSRSEEYTSGTSKRFYNIGYGSHTMCRQWTIWVQETQRLQAGASIARNLSLLSRGRL